MAEKNLSFSINSIILGRERPFLISEYKGKENDTEINKTGTDVISVLKTKVLVHEDRFFCIYFLSGTKFPYAAKVFDTKINEESDNPRPLDDIELKEQLFVLIDQQDQKIYFSDYKQKNQIRTWIQKNIQGKDEVTIRPLFGEKDFIDRMKSIDSICLTVEPGGLFNGIGGETLSQVMNRDALGHNAVEATLLVKYKKHTLKELRDRAKELVSNKAAYKKVTIVGKDIDGFESTLNTSEIVSKIVIDSPQDDSKKYIPEEVFLELIKQIKNRNEE